MGMWPDHVGPRHDTNPARAGTSIVIRAYCRLKPDITWVSYEDWGKTGPQKLYFGYMR